MILTPDYLITKQSEKSPWADHTPSNSLPHPVFKNLFLKAIGQFRSSRIRDLHTLVDTYKKHCIFFPPNLMPVDSLYCTPQPADPSSILYSLPTTTYSYYHLLDVMANHFSILVLRTPWTGWKDKMIGYWKRNSPGSQVPNMLLEISGEITPERMKGWNQSKNNTQLWMWLVIEAKSDAVKSNIA